MKNKGQILQKKPYYNLYFWGVCFILFLPVLLLPPNFNPSDWNRAILFRISISLFLFAILARHFFKKSRPLGWRRVISVSSCILLAFLGMSLLATLFSQDIRFSIFGSPERAGGFLNLVFLVLFSLLIPLLIKADDWKKLWNFSFIIGVFTSLIAFIQYFNIFGNILISARTNPPSTLGNSTFLAIYLLLLLFPALTFFLGAETKKKKFIYAGLFLLFGFTILITGSRATYLAVLASLLYFLFFYPKKFKLFKIIAGAILSFAIIIVLLFNFFPQIASGNDFLSRISSRLSIKTIIIDIGQTRFSAWKTTIKAIEQKPLLGWGLENQQIGIEKNYDPSLPNMQKIWWDRAHNIFLDIAVTSGIPSLIVYITFWIFLFIQLQKRKKIADEKEISTIHFLQSAFIGYFIVMCFNFDSFLTSLFLFFCIGHAFSIISRDKINAETIQENPSPTVLNKPDFNFILLALFILFVYFFNLKPFYINTLTAEAENLVDAKRCTKAAPIIENAAKHKSLLMDAYVNLQYVSFVKNCSGNIPGQELNYAQKGKDILLKNTIIQPKFVRTWILLSGLTNYIANKEQNPETKSTILGEARGYAEKALELSPKRQEAISEIAKSYIIGKDYVSAKNEAEKCQALNSDFPDCYWYLGVSELYLNQIPEGKKNIQIAKDKGYPISYTPSLVQLADIYITTKDFKELEWIYQDLAGLNPNNAQYHASLALVYKELGKYDEAVAQATAFLKLQPQSKEEIENFVKILMGMDYSNPQFHVNLANFYQELGQYDKSKEEILLSYELLKATPEAKEDPSLLLYARERIDEFLKNLEFLKAQNNK